jgi:hypothetical protein
LVRAPVSKTGGWGFESLLSCQINQRVTYKILVTNAIVKSRGSYTGNNALRRAALEKAGVEFIAESGGAGVRLRNAVLK